MDIESMTTPEILAELVRRGTTYAGTCRLLQWKVSSKVMLASFTLDQLDDDGELILVNNPFQGCLEGAKDGQRFFLVASMAPEPVARQEAPVEAAAPPMVHVKQSWHEMSYPQRAGLLCGDSDFQDYIAESFGTLWAFGDEEKDADRAARVLRKKCNISSRSEIKPGAESELPFINMEADFFRWKAKQNEVPIEAYERDFVGH